MLDVQVILLGGDSQDLSKKSIELLLPDGDVVESDKGGVISIVRESGPSLIHVVSAGSIIIPRFYESASVSLEHTKKDYAFCSCMVIEKSASIIRPEDGLVFSQMVVRRWVLQELANENDDLVELFDKVVSEYRGEEIPYVLCVNFMKNGDNDETN